MKNCFSGSVDGKDNKRLIINRNFHLLGTDGAKIRRCPNDEEEEEEDTRF